MSSASDAVRGILGSIHTPITPRSRITDRLTYVNRRSARIGSSRRLAGNMALRIDMCGCDQLLRCSGVVVPGWLPAGGTGPARCGG